MIITTIWQVGRCEFRGPQVHVLFNSIMPKQNKAMGVYEMKSIYVTLEITFEIFGWINLNR